MTRKLYLQLYLALLGATLLCLLAVVVAVRVLGDPVGAPAERLRHAAAILSETLRDVPDAELPARLAALGNDLAMDVSVWTPEHTLLASTSKLPVRPPPGSPRRWNRRNAGLELFAPLEHGRLAGMRVHHRLPRPRISFGAGLLLLSLVMAAASYPVARRLTKRLETLAAGVERWGAGELAHRVDVEGQDEVATLASTFNRAAAQVDALVAQQRDTLANASHELRSPLARLQMALTLVGDEVTPERRSELIENAQRDIADLDALIEELLLMARADVRTPRRPLEQIELLTLLRSEAERVHATVEGDAQTFTGDALLLRHALRNLLENAERYAGGKDIRALLAGSGDQITLAIEDRGPGISEAERERIFAPFYRVPGSERIAHGAGIGLSLVRQVARYHGGEARALPRPGGGSRFELVLPRRAPIVT